MDKPALSPDRKPVPFLAWLFLIYALPTIIFLSIVTPPFQVADEYAHALRADQISRGTLISPRLGGNVDGGLAAFGLIYIDQPMSYDRKNTVDMARAATAAGWKMPRFQPKI